MGNVNVSKYILVKNTQILISILLLINGYEKTGEKILSHNILVILATPSAGRRITRNLTSTLMAHDRLDVTSLVRQGSCATYLISNRNSSVSPSKCVNNALCELGCTRGRHLLVRNTFCLGIFLGGKNQRQRSLSPSVCVFFSNHLRSFIQRNSYLSLVQGQVTGLDMNKIWSYFYYISKHKYINL